MTILFEKVGKGKTRPILQFPGVARIVGTAGSLSGYDSSGRELFNCGVAPSRSVLDDTFIFWLPIGVGGRRVKHAYFTMEILP